MLWPLLSASLLVACGKVVVDHHPIEQSAGASSAGPAAGAAPRADYAGAGGIHPTLPPALDAGTPRIDAGTPPPKSAADGGSEDDAGSAPATLCDGSQALRLAYYSSGGFVAQTFGFTNPYGLAFLAVDGKCRYFVEDYYMHGIISGTLTPTEAEQLSAELHWNDLDSWAAYGLSKDAPCPDSGVVALIKAKASAGCSCGCDPAAPSGLGDALQKSYQWLDKLKKAGKPLEGPVSAVMLEGTSANFPGQPEFEWPLSRAISSIPNLIVDPADPKLWMGTGPWARFEDATEYAKLRELRRATVSSELPNSVYQSQVVLLRDGSKKYSVYVRDELPAETERAWNDLQATLPKQ
ncbi:MAG TPA: hypothetical protein VJR89_27300 [Polyangiales bacterium]|nr:hypothetical protein [Polyangiales bacterium]